jgi:hypothetical protein
MQIYEINYPKNKNSAVLVGLRFDAYSKTIDKKALLQTFIST